MGMHISNRNNTLYYLTDQDNWPNWYPSQLFEVKDHLLPRDWYTQVYNDRKEYMIYLLTGFKELCMNDDFFDALAEREDFAMQSYFTCKQDLERRYQERDELKVYGVDEGIL